jgi:hypothetical protein
VGTKYKDFVFRAPHKKSLFKWLSAIVSLCPHLQSSVKNVDPPLCSIGSRITDIRLLSYNIFIRPPGVNNNGNDHKTERLRLFVKKFVNYDIICLQEMFGFSRRKGSVFRAAEKAGLVYRTRSDKKSAYTEGRFLDAGLVILSRFSIVRSAFYTYPIAVSLHELTVRWLHQSCILSFTQIHCGRGVLTSYWLDWTDSHR